MMNIVWRRVFILYTLIGTEIEERKLVVELGQHYAEYRHEVRRFAILLLLGSLVTIGCASSPAPLNSDSTAYQELSKDRFIDWNHEDWKFQRNVFAEAYMFGQNHARIDFQIYQKATQYHGPVKAITHTLENLETAVGLDPSNPYTWQHLGFFTGLVGDRERQLQALDTGLLALAREALLLQALVMVDQVQIHEARSKVKNIGGWQLPKNRSPAQSENHGSPILRKKNLEQNDRQQALSYLNNQKWLTEFPPHLNYRFFQDIGRIQEHFDQWNKAKVSYGFAMLFRPFFPFFPMHGATGLSRIFSQAETGRTYYLGYGNFFLAGSYFSYAANRVIALEVASTPEATYQIGQDALKALTTCIARGIRTSGALALRGRVHYRLENFKFAEEDLHQAYELLTRYNEMKPRDGFGWYNRALVHLHLANFDQARFDLENAQLLDPENQAISRVLTLVSDHPHANISLTSGRVELKISRRDSLLFAKANNPNLANMVTNTKQQDIERLLKNLKTGYVEDPTIELRLPLALTMVQAGRMKEVQKLLIPLWPDNLSREEIML